MRVVRIDAPDGRDWVGLVGLEVWVQNPPESVSHGLIRVRAFDWRDRRGLNRRLKSRIWKKPHKDDFGVGESVERCVAGRVGTVFSGHLSVGLEF